MTNEHEAAKSPEGLGISGETLATSSLILRPLSPADASAIAKLANNYKVASMTESMPYPYYEADALRFIERCTSNTDDNCVYAIVEAGSGSLVGVCGLHANHGQMGMPYMGYWLGESHWGKGYATEAARALVDFFFKAGSQDELLISVLTENAASRRVIEKCGGKFWRKGTGTSVALEGEREVDHFKVTRESWMGAIAA